MAALEVVTCQADLTPKARAIRHLAGSAPSASDYAKVELQLEVAKLHLAKRPTLAPPTPEFPHGERFPDVSSYQAHVDLATVRRDNYYGELVVFKATEGLGYTDGYLVSRWRAAEAAGFPHRGAYHFLHMDESGQAQAEYFLAELHRASTDGIGPKAQDIVIADAEITSKQSPSTVAQVVDAFGLTLKQHCPAKRWLYTGGPFATENRLSLSPYDAHWLPAYVGDPKPYYVFGVPVAWQFTDGIHGPTPHVVEGIGPCDLSIVL